MYTIYLDHFRIVNTTISGNPAYEMTTYILYNPILASTSDDYAIGDTSLHLELSQAGELTITVPPMNNCWGIIAAMRDNIRVYDDDELIFFGRPVMIDRNLYNVKTVQCEGPLAFLNDVAIYGHTRSETFNSYVSFLLNYYNDWVGSSGGTGFHYPGHADRKILIDPSRSLQSDSVYVEVNAWESILDCMTNAFTEADIQGYYYIRYVSNGTDLNDVILYITRPEDPNMNVNYPQIILGENLIDFSETVDGTEIANSIIPLGKDDITISSVHGGYVNILDLNSAAEYGRIEKVVNYSDIDNAQDLYDKATQDIADGKLVSNAVRQITLGAVDLTRLGYSGDKIRLGNHVKFTSIPHGYGTVEENGIFLVTGMDLDLLSPSNDSYVFGTEKALTGQIAASGRNAQNQINEKQNRMSSMSSQTINDICV